MMFKRIFITLVLGVVSHAYTQQKDLHGRLGSWKELHDKGFCGWSVNFYAYKGGVADGGSYGFEFKTTKGSEFGILIANPEYWNDEELKNRSQVFYVLEGDVQKGREFYKILIGSKEERDIIQMLSAALANKEIQRRDDSGMLKKLISHLKSRKIFEPVRLRPGSGEE